MKFVPLGTYSHIFKSVSFGMVEGINNVVFVLVMYEIGWNIYTVIHNYFEYDWNQVFRVFLNWVWLCDAKMHPNVWSLGENYIGPIS